MVAFIASELKINIEPARSGLEEHAALVGAVSIGSVGHIHDRLELDIHVLERQADGLAGAGYALEHQPIEPVDEKPTVAGLDRGELVPGAA